MFTYEKIADGFVYYKNVYKNPKSIIDNIEHLQNILMKENNNKNLIWQNWYNKANNDLIFCKKFWIQNPIKMNKEEIFYNEKLAIAEPIFSGLDLVYQHYSKILYPYAARNIKGNVDEVNILKYEKSGHLPEHIDQGISSRVLSVVAYLNDDYEGGEITFTSIGDGGISIKPESGSAIFFPSNFVGSHTVKEITSGTRYAVPNWYHNRIDKIGSDGTE
jgi:hypothetical protein